MPRCASLLATAVGMVATAAFALPSAAAAAPQDYSASQLAAVSSAIGQSGVQGIAWYVDSASSRVVVTADSGVSRADITKVRKSGPGAVRIERTSGVF